VKHAADLLLIPYGDDPLGSLADHILTRHGGDLPDLTHISVLIPDLQAAPRLHRLLLSEAERQGAGALLGPTITTLDHWLEHTVPLAERVPTSHARELILVEALMEHPALFGHGNPWALAEDLLALFDELALHRVALPSHLDEFAARLRVAYRLDDRPIAALDGEARLVHTLWQAWHRQLADDGLTDLPTARLRRLAASPGYIETNQHLYLAGYTQLTTGELGWARALLEQGRLTVLIHGQRQASVHGEHYHPDAPVAALLHGLELPMNPRPNAGATSPLPLGEGGPKGRVRETPPGPKAQLASPPTEPLTRLLDETFTGTETPMGERARAYGAHHPTSPAMGRLHVLRAPDAEAEASAVDIQVRQWLLDGVEDIGIVTEDRRLARRVRALLERAGVPLEDAAGWALSTTRAASALERWLQCLEEDFDHQPLLDLLKSPFVLPDWDRDTLLAAVFRLEQDIILHENVARGLERYRHHLEFRRHRLPAQFAASGAAITALLDTVQDAAAPLARYVGAGKHRPGAYIEALRESLDRLGMLDALEYDEAGRRVLEELQLMHSVSPTCALRLSWAEFRAWLGRTLERYNFRPRGRAGRVRLLGIAQTSLLCFDALILAGADRDHLPGNAQRSAFFNDAVRHQLGLPTRRCTLAQRFHHFRRLLEAAPKVLLTVRLEQAGEEVLPSPWLEAIQSFHDLAYGSDLKDKSLAALMLRPEAQVNTADTGELPTPMQRPAPSVPPALLPPSVSASAHQHLIDCPYQFYGLHCLKLAPPEELREALEKADYGERVHRCLEAFHGGVPGRPGPFQEPITPGNRAAAIECLETIAAAEFAHDLEDNFMHRGWFKRWRALIPAYIDWQIAREPEWSVDQVEVRQEAQIGPALTLKGRLDRIDRHGDALAVVDYKTGAIPKQDAVDRGEAVQLPSYALVMEQPATRVEYLALDNRGVRGAASLAGEPLIQLRQQVGRRLEQVTEALAEGAPTPAWGDEATCRYCPLRGVCRREAWMGTED